MVDLKTYLKIQRMNTFEKQVLHALTFKNVSVAISG